MWKRLTVFAAGLGAMMMAVVIPFLPADGFVEAAAKWSIEALIVAASAWGFYIGFRGSKQQIEKSFDDTVDAL